MMKYGRNRGMLTVFAFFMFSMFSMLFSGCAISERESVDMGEVKMEEVSSQKMEQTGEVSDKDIKLEFLQEDTGVEDTQEAGSDFDEIKKQFGENCISDQTFEVELSEFQGKVYFVPFLPSSQDGEFSMQIIQDGEVLEEIRAYVPERLKEESFKSLDAVSFYDVNYDGNTDLVLIETYGNFMFTAVYYGGGVHWKMGRMDILIYKSCYLRIYRIKWSRCRYQKFASVFQMERRMVSFLVIRKRLKQLQSCVNWNLRIGRNLALFILMRTKYRNLPLGF